MIVVKLYLCAREGGNRGANAPAPEGPWSDPVPLVLEAIDPGLDWTHTGK
ncbi:hypothetical protein [Paenibacillus andongensis]|nr:hypothetical protein [Paenibacillus andongensis]